jgi:hypothetical protein
MGLQPTASRTALLLQCGRPFAPDTHIPPPEEKGEDTLFGSAVHALLKQAASKGGFTLDDAEGEAGFYGLTGLAGEVFLHASAMWKCLQEWRTPEGNPLGIALKVVGVETPRAWRPPSGKPRDVSFDADTHTYEIQIGEIGGTYDVLLESEAHDASSGLIRVILDYKTGTWGDFSRPGSLPQLRTLALMEDGVTHLAILHAPRGGVPVVYIEPAADKFGHARALRDAMARVGDGSMRPGPECKFCEARGDCPARDGELAKTTMALARKAHLGELSLNSEVNDGLMHMFVGSLEKAVERWRADLKERVKGGEVVQRPDGKTLTLVTRQVERLSKEAFIKALGKAEAEEEFDKLRASGVLLSKSEERLEAK